MQKLSHLCVVLAVLAALTGCETTQPATADTASPAPKAMVEVKPETTVVAPIAPAKPTTEAKIAEPFAPLLIKPEQLLAEGIDLYEKGDFRGAIRKLTAVKDTADEGSAIKQRGLKFLAFSYCVTSQRALCKAQFANLLANDPGFQLSKGEAGHPLWGPVFKETKATGAPKKAK